MMNKLSVCKLALFILTSSTLVLLSSCANQTPENQETEIEVTDTISDVSEIIDSTTIIQDTPDPDIDFDEVHEEAADSLAVELIELAPGDYDPTFFSDDSLVMESMYIPMLEPILSLKTSDPKTYWFIVSWLNTAYKTPNWSGYEDYKTWQKNALINGVDCSGFTRVMCDRIFGTKVAGSSNGIYTSQCDSISRAELKKGDLVFFRAPYSEKGSRIVHVGIYLFDDYFVHATSTKSATKGRGLMINSLNEENWAVELEGMGRVKSNYERIKKSCLKSKEQSF